MSSVQPIQPQVASLRGLRTAWLHGGIADRPILLFLHGYPDAADSWMSQLESFQQDYRVVAPYGRGVQPSEAAKQMSRYGLDAVTLDHLQVLKAIDPSQRQKVVLIGHDVGATQAWALAPLLGERLAGPVAVNGLHGQQMLRRLRQPGQHLRALGLYSLAASPVAAPLLRRYPGKFLTEVHKRGGLSVSKRPVLSQLVGGVVHPLNYYRAYWRDVPRMLAREPRVITRPVLVLWSDATSVLARPSAQEMDLVATDYQVRAVGGQHWPHRERADEINQLLHSSINKWLH